MARVVAPLVGIKSLKALNAFHTLLLGLKMLPAYMSQDYQTFYASFGAMSDGEKETKLREAVAFVQLAPEEVDALIGFCSDKNGVPYSDVNKGNLTVDEIFECIVAVCMEIGRIKIDLVSDDEKKKNCKLLDRYSTDVFTAPLFTARRVVKPRVLRGR